PNIVESDYGFHIIKLESKDAPAEGAAAQTYNVRHILISTGYKDPENPLGRETPIKVYVRNKLEEEREKKTIDEIVAKNNVQVPEDFDVPEVTDEQIQQAMEEQRKAMGLPEEGEEGADAPPPPPAKPESGQ